MPAEDELLALASSQGGCFTRHQAIVAGVTDERLRAQVKGGRWARVHRGVYAAAAGDLPWVSQVWAVLLVLGDEAASTGSTALRLYGVTSIRDDRAIHVAIDHSRRVVAVAGAVLHRRSGLAGVVHPSRQPRSVRIEEAALQHAAGLHSVVDGLAVLADVCAHRLTTPARLAATLATMPRLPNRGLWSRVLADVSAGANSVIELEHARRVERAHGLPTPRRQAPGTADGRRVWRDGRYDEFGVVVELDGRLGHEWARDHSADRRRDALALAQGVATVRLTYADILDPCRTAALLAAVLTSRGWAGHPQRCGRDCRVIELMP